MYEYTRNNAVEGVQTVGNALADQAVFLVRFEVVAVFGLRRTLLVTI